MRIPSESEITKAFQELRAKNVKKQLWTLYAQWTRFDPRLGEAWLSSLAKFWKVINPLELREENLKTDSPAVMGVLLDQCEMFLIHNQEAKLFRAWKNVVLCDVLPASGEVFLIGLHPFGSMSMMNEMLLASKVYKRWGFGGKDIFINKFSEKQETIQRSVLDKQTRFQILKDLLKVKKRITIKDYLLACESRISSRLAQIDLSTYPGLIAKGASKGRFYVKGK